MIHLHDGNIDQFAEEHAGHLCSAMRRQSRLGEMECAGLYADTIDLIPESKWDACYQAMIGKFARQRYEAQNPVLQDQDGHPLCWAFSLAQAMEATRATQGLPYVQLAPESITGCNGYRDRGGSLDVALNWVAKHGMAPRSMVSLYNLRPQTWKAGYEEEAMNYVPLARYDLGAKDMRAEVMTALLEGEAVYVAYMVINHAMTLMEIQKTDGAFSFWTPNTWGKGRDMLWSGRRLVPDEAYVLRQMTYSKP